MISAKGSEWRKWDLHLHTPFTKLSNSFPKSTEDAVWKEYCEKIEASDVQVFGITDYFCVKNFFIFKEKHKELFPSSQKVFFPNIEFRLDVSVNRAAEEVNVHVIFSDKVPQATIQGFLAKLKTTATRGGATIYCDQLQENEFSGATVDYKEIIRILAEIFGNDKPYLIISAANNAGIRPDTRAPRKVGVSMEIDKKMDAVFGSRVSIQYYLSTDRYESKDGPSNPIPVFYGCDAHSFEDLDSYLGKIYINKNQNSGKEEIHKDILWIKAETTFLGLLQVLTEPTRVFFGEQPDALRRVAAYPTKYIKSLAINKTHSDATSDIWFDDLNVELNPEMVAIIGNKGKGKSAISDILGLCANAHIKEDDFSFLHKDKFKNPKSGMAKSFVAVLEWYGGNPNTKNLNDAPDLDSPERVKYIPQSFLEKLCTDVDKDIFETELEKVIYLRLPDHQKAGKATLQEVMNEKQRDLQRRIQQVKADISICNVEIVELENKNSAAFRRSTEESLTDKLNEFTVHQGNKPIEKTAPNESDEGSEKTSAVSEEITGHRNSISELEKERSLIEVERVTLESELQELNSLKADLESLTNFVDRIKDEHQQAAVKFALDWEEMLGFNVRYDSIDTLLVTRQDRIAEINQVLSATSAESYSAKISMAEIEITRLQQQLAGESMEYEKYRTDLMAWERQNIEIEGSKDAAGSLKYYQHLKLYLNNELSADLEKARKLRTQHLQSLLAIKESISSMYSELYKPLTEFIEENRGELNQYAVNIDVVLGLSDFENKFFNYIAQNTMGSFYGSAEGRKELKLLTETRDFNKKDDVIAWIDDILDHLQYDRRDGQPPNTKRELGAQMKGGYKEKDFYDFLFFLDYYEPGYQLKLGSKSLTELSPGERGALLLIFYLLLDNRDIPIIIDQPEENLDNQSVFNILVHFVKKAKSKRQIIIVTHNPNLAVVCDAEQVIRMDIAKEKQNRVSLITGGIEDPSINRAIVDILEGTRPAFNNRTVKYDLGNN